MPSQKNQHYVPRCALKPFTRDRDGKAIHVFNLKAQRAIEDAPVKNQCSKDYFYGKDLTLENVLKDLEGQYARIVSLIELGVELTPGDTDFLRLFVNIQSRRTARAVRETMDAVRGMTDETFKHRPEQRPPDISQQEAMAASLGMGMDLQAHTQDLKFVILENQTDTNFITSDNPAVMTNRFSFEKLKAGAFGFGNSGAIIAMPISPKFCVLLFDIGVYTMSIPQGTSVVKLTDPKDVHALNELQHLNAESNIYYAGEREAASIAEQSKSTMDNRVSQVGEFTTLIRDRAVRGEAYRRGTPSEEQQSTEGLVAGSFVQPKPSTWPPVLKYRPKPVVVNTKSAAGHLRPAIAAMPPRPGSVRTSRPAPRT